MWEQKQAVADYIVRGHKCFKEEPVMGYLDLAW